MPTTYFVAFSNAASPFVEYLDLIPGKVRATCANLKHDKEQPEKRERRAFRPRDDNAIVPVCGLHAVDAVFRYKPNIVERLFFDEETGKYLGEVCKFLAGEKKPYRQVHRSELERIGKTKTHGGVVAITRRRPLEKGGVKAAEFWSKEGLPMLILDNVSNTNNLGALARAAAFFGVQKMVLANTRRQALPSASAYRMARGGLDMLDIRLVDNLPVFIKSIRRHYVVIGSVFDAEPMRDLLSLVSDRDVGKPVAIVVGNEDVGVSDPVAEACHATVSIPGAGTIDCLNVASEAAILLQKYVVEGY